MFMIYADDKLVYQPGTENLQVLSPKLTVEIGKAGSLDFSVPPTNPRYNEFQQLKSTLVVKLDDLEIFRGRILSGKRDFNNVRQIYGEGNLAYLIDSVQKATTFNGKTGTLFRNIIAAHNKMIKDSEKQFTVGTIAPEFENVDIVLVGKSKDSSDSDEMENLETDNFNYKQIALDSIADEWQSTFDYIETCLIEYLGGYLRTRHDASTGVTYIDWLKDYFSTTSQSLEFGKNILDLTQEINAEDVFSVLIPLGDENLTIASVNNGSIELVDDDLVAKYGRIVRTNVFDSVTSAATLLENAQRYLKTNAKENITINITAVDLHVLYPNIETISLGDRAYIRSPAHGVDTQEYTCTRIEYDLANPANTVYTFGKPDQTLTERYRKDKQERNTSTSRSSSSSAAAVAEKVDENQTDFYKAWVTVENDKGHIDLGTLFKRVVGGETQITGGTLITLDSNPEHSAIDIWADHHRYENDRKFLSTKVGINLDAGESAAAVDIYAMDARTQKAAEFLLKVGYKENGDVVTIAQLNADHTNINSALTKVNGILEAIDFYSTYVNVKRAIHTDYIKAGALVTASRVNKGYMFNVSDHQHVVSFTVNGQYIETVTGKPYGPYA